MTNSMRDFNPRSRTWMVITDTLPNPVFVVGESFLQVVEELKATPKGELMHIDRVLAISLVKPQKNDTLEDTILRAEREVEDGA